MAKTKKTSAIPKTTRPYNALYVLIFAVASVYAGWLMRIETGIKGIPVNFVEQVEARTYPNGMPMRTHYTGIEVIDSSLLFLVAAFLAGPLAWDEGVRVQQLHFLVQFFAVIAVWNVEACRTRNSWKLISFTGLFVLFYQTIAGAAIIPLYYLSYVLISKPDAYYVSSSHVSPPHARGLLFSISIGYLLPTLAMYLPGLSASTTQFLVFLWQPSPGFVNILLFAAARLLPSAPAGSRKGSPDITHVKRVYAAAGVVCAVNHLVTMYVCATATNPQLSFAHVFVPDHDTWMDSTTAGLHYIFQVDWWGCFLPTLLWAWIAVYDVHRLLLGSAGAAQLVKWAVYIVGLTVALGPGGMLAVVWSWREDRLLMIESGVRGTIQKPKTA
ncbi:hypothetical protein GGS24DRAFT_494166 [Hypoxylon argillaceum]|nr:hypothetical protein GGS24DRAFT_494166 [Hypoxylon argillaceum]KAI1147127.1 hypothetical protein F4825DRAFT_465965 [Nemania diffusa]